VIGLKSVHKKAIQAIDNGHYCWVNCHAKPKASHKRINGVPHCEEKPSDAEQNNQQRYQVHVLFRKISGQDDKAERVKQELFNGVL